VIDSKWCANPEFGGVQAKGITRRDIRALLDRIATRRPITANRVKALLSKMFNWGVLNEIVEQTFEGHGFRFEGTESKVNDSLIALAAKIVVGEKLAILLERAGCAVAIMILIPGDRFPIAGERDD
jgi:non-ribosomal peptide synthetase component F